MDIIKYHTTEDKWPTHIHRHTQKTQPNSGKKTKQKKKETENKITNDGACIMKFMQLLSV